MLFLQKMTALICQLPQLLFDLRQPVFHVPPLAAGEQTLYVGQLRCDPLLFSLQSGDSVKPLLFRYGFALLFSCDSSVHYIIKVVKQLPARYIASTIAI